MKPDLEIERISQWKATGEGFEERLVFSFWDLNYEKMLIPLKKKYNVKAQYFGGHAYSNYFEMLASTARLFYLFYALADFLACWKCSSAMTLLPKWIFHLLLFLLWLD